MKRFLVICLFLGTIRIAQAGTTDSTATVTPVRTSIWAELSPAACNPLYRRTLYVEQTLYFDSPTGKEVRLQMHPAGSLAQQLWNHSILSTTLGYHSFLGVPCRKVYDALKPLTFRVLIDGKETRRYRFSTEFTTTTLTIPVKANKPHTVTVCYDFYSDMYLPFYAQGMQTRLSLCLFGNNEAWYFSTDNIVFDEMQLLFPDDEVYLFSNVSYHHDNRTYILTPAEASKGVILAFVEKELYDKHEAQTDFSKVAVYFQRDFRLGTDCTILDNRSRFPEEEQQRKLSNACKWVKGLENFFGDSIRRTLNITDANLVMSAGYDIQYGFAMRPADKRYTVVCDTGFWRSPHVVHELAHTFMEHRIADERVTSLFGESMVEFIATCVYRNMDTAQIARTFAHYYNRLTEEEKQRSVFSLYNRIGSNSQTIYCKAPYIMFQFAQRIGFEQFMGILKQYYTDIRTEDKAITWDNFEAFFKSHGISDGDWEWLYHAL